jgi:lipopolysaccharide biosynthesis regulator YciM
MPEPSSWAWSTWALISVAALVVGILAGHFGWGRRWTRAFGKLHPDYLAGLDFLVSEQPDRALDMFLKLMDANSDTIETHFALGSLYRRRGEVERSIRIHQNLLARDALLREHREQALLALAQDYLRAGLLDRAEGLLLEVSGVPRLRASALVSLRGVYERQHEWQQALDTYRQLARMKAAPARSVAAHYLCELAAPAIELGDIAQARDLLRKARREAAPFPRAALLRAKIAELQSQPELALKLMRLALDESPALLQEELTHLLRLAGDDRRDIELEALAATAQSRGGGELKSLGCAAIGAGVASAAPLRAAMEEVFRHDSALAALWRAAGGELGRVATELGALLAHAERYRCAECGFSGRSFYWHCPACQSWESFQAHAMVKLR